MFLRFKDTAIIEVMLASTKVEQDLGLIGFHYLEEHTGMVFPFGDPQRITMHTIGMSIPIDILFVGEDNKIIGIIESVDPGIPEISCEDACAVIEVPAGYCQRYNIRVGDGVETSED